MVPEINIPTLLSLLCSTLKLKGALPLSLLIILKLNHASAAQPHPVSLIFSLFHCSVKSETAKFLVSYFSFQFVLWRKLACSFFLIWDFPASSIIIMSGRTRFPFTPSQWQELEHQALIYKYMVSGISIPPDLLFSIKRSCLDSPLPSKLFSHHPPHIGWSCFQMGLGRKVDPEPGRCRRTDGKKWRCSKEAFADSKYCERHMHRGKNRSRKPVEVFKTPITTNSNPSSSTPTTISSITSKNNPPSTSTPTFHSLSSSLSSLSSESHHTQLNHSSYNTNLDHHPFLYHHTSSSRPPGFGLSHQERNTSLLLDSGSYPPASSEYRNRYVYGLKEEVDEHAFFSEPSGSVRDFSGSSSMDDSWQFTPLTMSTCTSSSSKQRSCSALQSEHSHLQLQSNLTPKQQNYYALGSDMKMDRNEGTQKTIHRFFDEWPLKDKDSWLDLDDKSSNSGSVSNTRLSISTHDFPIFSSRNHNDD